MKLLNGMLGVGLVLASTCAVAAPRYDRLYVFGDSFSDVGAGYLDGNGPTAVAYLAENLKIPFTQSRDPEANTKGIDFAVTAAGSGEAEGQPSGELMFAVGMINQAQDFAARVRAGKIHFDPETTLFLIEGGLNDTDSPARTTVDNITRQIEILKSVGARHVSLSLLPTRIPDFSEVALKLNPAYRTLVPQLRKTLKIDVQLNDFGVHLDDILANPAKYGIAETEKPCAGRALFKEDPAPCAAPDTYFYYHRGHPSTAVNRIVGRKLYDEISGGAH